MLYAHAHMYVPKDTCTCAYTKFPSHASKHSHRYTHVRAHRQMYVCLHQVTHTRTHKQNTVQVNWHVSLSSVPQDLTAIYIAHEFFDALPVHQFVKDARCVSA